MEIKTIKFFSGKEIAMPVGNYNFLLNYLQTHSIVYANGSCSVIYILSPNGAIEYGPYAYAMNMKDVVIVIEDNPEAYLMFLEANGLNLAYIGEIINSKNRYHTQPGQKKIFLSKTILKIKYYQ